MDQVGLDTVAFTEDNYIRECSPDSALTVEQPRTSRYKIVNAFHCVVKQEICASNIRRSYGTPLSRRPRLGPSGCCARTSRN